MAWTSATISGAEWTAHTDDKPCLVGTHALKDSYAAAATGGIWTQTGKTTDADETLTGYPVIRAYDGFGQAGLWTAPDAVQITWYLCFDLSANPIEFDTVYLQGAEGPTAVDFEDADLIQVEIADDTDFTVRNEAPLIVSPGSPYTVGSGPISRRVFHTQLTHDFPDPKRYSNVAYLRIVFSHAAGLLQPRVSEVWLGRRRQLLHFPELPFDDHHEFSAVDHPGRAGVGVSAPYLRHRGAARRNLEVAIDTSDTDQIDAIEDWWVDSKYATRPWLWIESPGTAPEGYVMAWDGDVIEYDPILVGPTHRRISIPMTECDPIRSQAP